MPKTIWNISSMDSFYHLLSINPGLVIIKFGATWCGPCKKIEKKVDYWFEFVSSNEDVQTVLVDIDESFEVYAFLKNKKMVKGIPAILMYKKGNNTFVFDDIVNTTVDNDIDDFFKRCIDVKKASIR